MKVVAAIIGLSCIACVAMLTGNDGVIVQSVITAVAGMIGYGIAKEVNKKEKEDSE